MAVRQRTVAALPTLMRAMRKEAPPRNRTALPSLRRAFSLYDQINLITDVPEDQLRFQGFDDTGFKVNGVKYEGSLLCVGNLLMSWTPKKFSDITAESLSIFKTVRPIPGIMAVIESLIQKIGRAVKAVEKSRSSEWWYTPHMAAASRAIAERAPLVDLVLEVRDARIPLSSECLQLRKFRSSSNRIIVLNKMDLANRSQTMEWMKFFEEHKCMAFGVNAHNKENIKEFLTFLKARVRELKRIDDPARAVTLMLVGIPNVGKSALANSLHLVGRIAAAEKGRLKHSVVTPLPGETQGISSLKIASHPNIYVLDTPGVLPPNVSDDDEVCSKLALTGAIKDTVVGEVKLAEYFLSILNLADEYKKWGKLSCSQTGGVLTSGGSSYPGKTQKKRCATDHTQDFIVNSVRRTLFDAVSSFAGSVGNGEDLARLTEEEFEVLQKIFHIPLESKESNYCRVAKKLLNLYRTGRLGYYTLDLPPNNAQRHSPMI